MHIGGKMINKKLLLGVLALTLSNMALAVTIGIIDSGTDMKHKDIASKAWTNLVEIPDNQFDDDGNDFADDIFGWNFVEDNNQVIDYQFLGKFSADVYTFFNIQAKMIDGLASSSEILWMKEKLGHEVFHNELLTFGNFIHGTHVAGISLKDSDKSKILAVKIIPTEVKLPDDNTGNTEFEDRLRGLAQGRTTTQRMAILKSLLNQISTEQMTLLKKVSHFLKGHNTDVANGSFGTGYKQVGVIVSKFFKPLLDRSPTPRELHSLILYFFENLLQEGSKVLSVSPDTLFVFAAGNDGQDNDEFPVSPANIHAKNSISVAATLGLEKLAKFSNYGQTMVEVAAPGVGILSTIPGNQYLAISGTSQAAPFVANVAGEIKNIAPDLSPAEVKEILVNTVDVKEFLRGKVASSGIVNRARALKAASYSRSNSVNVAISMAKVEVTDMQPLWSENKNFGNVHPEALDFVIPLPSDLVLVK